MNSTFFVQSCVFTEIAEFRETQISVGRILSLQFDSIFNDESNRIELKIENLHSHQAQEAKFNTRYHTFNKL